MTCTATCGGGFLHRRGFGSRPILPSARYAAGGGVTRLTDIAIKEISAVESSVQSKSSDEGKTRLFGNGQKERLLYIVINPIHRDRLSLQSIALPKSV